MDHDVDDQGWTYSFSFAPVFSWHGNVKWLSSFVRRRRWIRKRVRFTEGGEVVGGSEGSTTVSESLMRSALYRMDSEANSGEEEEEEIAELSMLMKKLLECRLDREKLDAVESFLTHGGEETRYLPEKVPEINKLLVFHESRRRLLQMLREHQPGSKEKGKGKMVYSPSPSTPSIWTLPPVISPPPLDKDLPTPLPPPEATSYFPISKPTNHDILPDNPISPKTVPPGESSHATTLKRTSTSISSLLDTDSEIGFEDGEGKFVPVGHLIWKGEEHTDGAVEAKLESKRKQERKRSSIFSLGRGKGKEKEVEVNGAGGNRP